MKIVKLLFRVILILVVIFLFFKWSCALLSRVNTTGRMLWCGNNLRTIANAMELYRADSNWQWPPSLWELGPYYKGEHAPGPNSIPQCPGDRNENQETGSSSQYYYYPPKVGGVVPICWDSKPHRLKGAFLPDKLIRKVLYSDMSIENVEEKEFIKEIEKLSESNPDVLKVVNIPEQSRVSVE